MLFSYYAPVPVLSLAVPFLSLGPRCPCFTSGCPWFAPSYAYWSMAVLVSFLTILVSAKSLPRGVSKNRGEIRKQKKPWHFLPGLRLCECKDLIDVTRIRADTGILYARNNFYGGNREDTRPGDLVMPDPIG